MVIEREGRRRRSIILKLIISSRCQLSSWAQWYPFLGYAECSSQTHICTSEWFALLLRTALPMSHQPQTPLHNLRVLPISMSLQSSSSLAYDSLLSGSFPSYSFSHFMSFATSELTRSAADWCVFPISFVSVRDSSLGSSGSSFLTSFFFHPFVSSCCISSYSKAASSSDSSEKFSSLSRFSALLSSLCSNLLGSFSLPSSWIYLPFSFIINGACNYFSSSSRPCLSTSFPSGFFTAFKLSLLSYCFKDGLAANSRYCGPWLS